MDSNYKIGLDVGVGRDSGIVEKFMRPTATYPDGSYLCEVDHVVKIATGYYATLYPDKPSPYWHGRAPFFAIDTREWPWEFGRGLPREIIDQQRQVNAILSGIQKCFIGPPRRLCAALVKEGPKAMVLYGQ